MDDSDAPVPPTHLERMQEVIDALRPVLLATHSEHGLQGLSGLVGQYRAASKEVDEIRAQEKPKGTPLDELAKRRSDRGADAPRKTRSSGE